MEPLLVDPNIFEQAVGKIYVPRVALEGQLPFTWETVLHTINRRRSDIQTEWSLNPESRNSDGVITDWRYYFTEIIYGKLVLGFQYKDQPSAIICNMNEVPLTTEDLQSELLKIYGSLQSGEPVVIGNNDFQDSSSTVMMCLVLHCCYGYTILDALNYISNRREFLGMDDYHMRLLYSMSMSNVEMIHRDDVIGQFIDAQFKFASMLDETQQHKCAMLNENLGALLPEQIPDGEEFKTFVNFYKEHKNQSEAAYEAFLAILDQLS